MALQVSNGMAGALLIEGRFDDWLRQYYRGQLVERLLVLEQIKADTNLFGKGGSPPLLVNGQVTPRIPIHVGEVQRWRVVNATLEGSSEIAITFPAGMKAVQIAMDGIQFAPENYQRQPLLPSNLQGFRLSPGNRADFLVQATAAALTAAPGGLAVTHRVLGSELSPRARENIAARERTVRATARGAAAAEVPLFSLEIVKTPANQQVAAAKFPDVAEWPRTPPYLRDVETKEIFGRPEVVFSMKGADGKPSGGGNPATLFFLNDKQFDPRCDDVTTTLGTADEWKVVNTTKQGHPFHIHTNPFQVIQNSALNPQPRPPYVWQDTVALPLATDKGPGAVILRQRYTEFTGPYVLHCHFLGHEDRGMMFGVQTICPAVREDHFGKARLFGPECEPNNLVKANPRCK